MTGPIEAKVKFATVASYLGSAGLLTALTLLRDNAGLVDFLPAYLSPFVLGTVPAAITLVTGYQARHTPRTDRDAVAAGDARAA